MKIGATLLILAALISSAAAMRNPAAVYCEGLGYRYTVESQGGQETGYCEFAPGNRADAWGFLQGKTAVRHSFCASQNQSLKVVKDPKACARLLTDYCAVCVLKDGTEKEVTEVMGLALRETVCGDGNCGYPETYEDCPQDCTNPANVKASTTTVKTLPATKPPQQQKNPGCWPLLLAPVTLLASAAAKLLKA